MEKKTLKEAEENSYILGSEEVFILELTENNLNINRIIFKRLKYGGLSEKEKEGLKSTDKTMRDTIPRK